MHDYRGGSFASGTGNVLTLTLNITFSSAFGGNKIIYAAARSLSFGNSGWQALGTWSVPALRVVPVSALGVSPARGSGLTQHFAFTFTDANGATSLDVLNILMNDFLNGEQACYLGYSRSLNVL